MSSSLCPSASIRVGMILTLSCLDSALMDGQRWAFSSLEQKVTPRGKRRNGKCLYATFRFTHEHCCLANVPSLSNKMTDRKAQVFLWDVSWLSGALAGSTYHSTALSLLVYALPFSFASFSWDGLVVVLYLFPSSSTTALAWYNAETFYP